MGARMLHLAELYGRDGYRGTFRPPVAAPRDRAAVVHLHRSNDHVLLAVRAGAVVKTMHIGAIDAAVLQTLGTDDRSRVHSALAAIQREAADASA